MEHKRIFVRVPIKGEAVLVNKEITSVKASTIDISQGGVAITTFSNPVFKAEYEIKIITATKQKIELTAHLVRVDELIAGFQILRVDSESQKIINEIVFEYQTTTDFIRQLDEFDMLEQTITDEEGNEVEITFEQEISEFKKTGF